MLKKFTQEISRKLFSYSQSGKNNENFLTKTECLDFILEWANARDVKIFDYSIDTVNKKIENSEFSAIEYVFPSSTVICAGKEISFDSFKYNIIKTISIYYEEL